MLRKDERTTSKASLRRFFLLSLFVFQLCFLCFLHYLFTCQLTDKKQLINLFNILKKKNHFFFISIGIYIFGNFIDAIFLLFSQHVYTIYLKNFVWFHLKVLFVVTVIIYTEQIKLIEKKKNFLFQNKISSEIFCVLKTIQFSFTSK